MLVAAMGRLFAVLCLLAVHINVPAQASGAETCLDDSIFPANAKRRLFRPDERRMITVLDQVQKQMPIGILSYNWASAEFVADVFRLLASEVLGFNVTISGQVGTTMAALYGIAGCSQPLNFADGYEKAGCGAEINEHHFAFEAWGGGNLLKMKVMEQELQQLSPENLGRLGYVGTESMYVVEGNYQMAWNTQGLALQFYTSFNADWNRPGDMFNDTTSINRTLLKHCREHRLTVNQNEDMRAYKTYTGDAAGVEEVDGSVRAVCDGPWWYSPTCRANVSACVPVISAGNGYAVESFMQEATAHRMPLAIATAMTWGSWEQISKESGTLLYWWTPDITFVELNPVEVIFPAYDGLAWSKGDKRTGPTSSQLSKWVNKRLRSIVPEAVDLAERMVFSSTGESGINAALFYKKRRGISDWADVACWWAQNYHEVWKEWIRDPTECSPGQGIVDVEGNSLLSRNASIPGGGDATSCAFCRSGYKSEEVKDTDLSYIFVCRSCGEGTYQEGAGSTMCNDCPVGMFNNELRATACDRCEKGLFSDVPGALACNQCEDGETTAGAGSLSPSECLCPEGKYRLLSDSKCAACPPGMFCNEGSDEKYLLTVGNRSRHRSDSPSDARSLAHSALPTGLALLAACALVAL